VRRGFVAEKYADLIEALFSEEVDEVPVQSVITYQDGRQSMIDTKLAIRSVDKALTSV
jgi:hypothetical protein